MTGGLRHIRHNRLDALMMAHAGRLTSTGHEIGRTLPKRGSPAAGGTPRPWKQQRRSVRPKVPWDMPPGMGARPVDLQDKQQSDNGLSISARESWAALMPNVARLHAEILSSIITCRVFWM